MDCKLECASRTLLRTEVLAIQGVLSGLLVFVIGVLVIPIVPFVYTAFVFTRDGRRWYKKLHLMPLWFLHWLLFAIVHPFASLLKCARDIVEVVRIEWKTRWLAGLPKRPNGKPAAVLTEKEMERMEDAIVRSVIADYNGEARQYGQGIELEDE